MNYKLLLFLSLDRLTHSTSNAYHNIPLSNQMVLETWKVHANYFECER